MMEDAIASNPERPGHHMDMGHALAGLGETTEAIAMGRRAMELRGLEQDATVAPVVHYNAIFHVFLPASATDTAAIDVAIEELDTFLGRPTWWSIEGLLPDPRLDPIRDDPRFEAVVEKYRRQ